MHIILEQYKTLVEFLGQALGSDYEVVLHDLSEGSNAIVAIVNGHISGRSMGAPLTALALRFLADKEYEQHDYKVGYRGVSRKNGNLRSSTMFIKDEAGQVIGMLCINFYLDSPLSEIVQSITGNPRSRTESEYFASSMPEALSEAIGNARKIVMQNPSIPSTNKNKELIRILYEKGIFKVKDAVASVAEALDISKNTVYLHLRSFQKETEG